MSETTVKAILCAVIPFIFLVVVWIRLVRNAREIRFKNDDESNPDQEFRKWQKATMEEWLMDINSTDDYYTWLERKLYVLR